MDQRQIEEDTTLQKLEERIERERREYVWIVARIQELEAAKKTLSHELAALERGDHQQAHREELVASITSLEDSLTISYLQYSLVHKLLVKAEAERGSSRFIKLIP